MDIFCLTELQTIYQHQSADAIYLSICIYNQLVMRNQQF